jgi:tetratricopeptide (TPR) repeat protein
MSPEQARGDGAAIDTRTDVFSIGAILAALVHQKDVAGHTLPVSDDLSLIIGIAMRESPDERYQTVESFAADLRALLEHRPIAARPPSATYQLSKYVRRHPARAAAAIVTVSALTLATVAVGVSWNRTVAAERDAANAGRLLLREVASLLHNRIGGFSEERRMLESLLPRLEPFAERYRDDPAIQNDLALLLGRLGDSYSQQYDHATALRHWERALESRRAVAALPDAGPDAAALHSIAVVRVGDEAGQLGDMSRRLHQYLEALRLDERSVARWPSHPGLASNLASSHERLGAIQLREGRLDDALRSSDRQLDLARKVGELEGDTRRALWDLACARGTRSIVLSAMLRFDESNAEQDHALTLYLRLAERFPGDRDIAIRLASAITAVPNLLEFMRHPQGPAKLDAAQRALEAVIAGDREFRQFLAVRVRVACVRARLRHLHDASIRDFPELDDLFDDLDSIALHEGKVDEAGISLEMLASTKATLLGQAANPSRAADAVRHAIEATRRWNVPQDDANAPDWLFLLHLHLAWIERPPCSDPLLVRLVAMESATPRALTARLQLLDTLRQAGCTESAARLADTLHRLIPVEWTEARRRLDVAP